jgi:hypothetical protein
VCGPIAWVAGEVWGCVVSDRFSADVDALGRLGPQVQELSHAIRGDAASGGSAAAGTDPALTAIGSATDRVLPNVEKLVAGWMNMFAQVCEAGRQGVIASEEHGVTLMNSAPMLGRTN